ncbi:alternative ribosome rescue aminoacyl-tRNA hydrolase ArfB [Spongiimicrobium sp. 3-5]|uniref:alternative ribosome rescue aminoacyl-tRNA hydrolase ArfB n=1 Tax=Spongiimicrobium sp. 3-5 TaxID=3332596 RepID=UPI00398163F1
MDKALIEQELRFKAVRSSGAGGQHVNKVATKVMLTFDLNSSMALSDEEKVRLQEKLGQRLTKEGLLIMHGDTTRSQHKNKELVVKRFLEVIENVLKVPKKRRKTKPSKSAIEKRLKAKQKTSEKKLGRKKTDLD